MSDREPTWAVISPAPLAALQAAADAHHPGEDFPSWEVRAGQLGAGHGAIIEYEPGLEYTHEESLAEALSASHAGKHYVLHFHEDSPLVAVFEAGKRRQVLDENPYAVVERLGFALVTPPAALDEDEAEAENQLVVAGHAPDAVAAALETAPAVKARLKFETVPLGTVVRAPSSEPRVGMWAIDLSIVLDARTYACSWFPARPELLCEVYEDGDRVARFAWPPSDDREPDDVETLLGQSTPEGVSTALGVTWQSKRQR